MPTKNVQSQYEVIEGAPEFYVDSAHVQTQLYSTTLLMGELRLGQPSLVKVIVKMSPPMMKVLSLLLGKHVKNYEADLGKICLPKPLLQELGIEEE